MKFTPFPSNGIFPSNQLPLTLMILNDWTLIEVSGQDSEKYLQGQFTADIAKISEHQHLLVAHCNYNGRTWSTLRLFRRGENFSFIERYSVKDKQLFELKKYAIFSKVTFTPNDNLVLLGIAGFLSRTALGSLFKELPSSKKILVNDGATSLLWFEYPRERFLIVTNKIIAHRVIQALRNNAQFNNSNQWLAMDIEAGIPIIDFPNSGLFIPQSINLQVLGGISFNKGCYSGQEIIARTKFRGLNKNSLWYLSGIENRVPKVGEYLELKIRKNWRRTGTILAAVKLNDGRLLIQAIMSKNLEKESSFRIKDGMNTLKIEPLPYSLE